MWKASLNNKNTSIFNFVRFFSSLDCIILKNGAVNISQAFSQFLIPPIYYIVPEYCVNLAILKNKFYLFCCGYFMLIFYFTIASHFNSEE